MQLHRYIGMVSRILMAAGVSAAVLLPTTTLAGMSNVSGSKTSEREYWDCIDEGHSRVLCGWDSIAVDPVMVSVTDFSLSVKYDTTKFTFKPDTSGPLGIFALGGDAPAPDPGIGTMVLSLLPSTGFTAGAALPGSTLTYSNVGGVLTVNYHLASPVTSTGDINFFRLDFNLIHPVLIDPTLSTVTYETSGPGKDFGWEGFSCTTTDGLNSCGSEHPSSGSTTTFSYVPEPTVWATMLIGFCGLGMAMRSHRRQAAATA